MGLRINTNVPSIAAQRTLSQTTKMSESVLGKLSSGSRIVSAADDAAGLAISEKLKATIKSVNQANRNTNDGISLVQTAEGALNEVSSILIRLRELAVQSASDTIGNTERGYTNLEFQSLKEEITRISSVTEFNGQRLLKGEEKKLDIQIGTHNNPLEDRIVYDAQKINAGLEKLGLVEKEIGTKLGAQTSLGVIDTAINEVSGQRANLGAMQNRLASTSRGLQVMNENLSAANSRIRDTDYAEMTAENTKLNILTQGGSSVLAQANQSGAVALKLIGS